MLSLKTYEMLIRKRCRCCHYSFLFFKNKILKLTYQSSIGLIINYLLLFDASSDFVTNFNYYFL